ncbi:MAG TPA: DUF2723 domain-containing protein [Gemmatimonadaceae bacterium]|nr:DUF2723 domain-containing protein [Gemmatimonadaceae bacterium]
MRISPYLKERNFYLSLSAVVLALGYLDLIRGGTTVSAFLLAIGYCALIPATIWAGAPADVERERPPYAAAAIVCVVVFAVYLLTMAPSTAMWDTSEYIAAAYAFGLPHPPGNPFFVIIGHVFALLPIAGNAAARVNILAGVASASSAALWFLITERVIARWLSARWMRIAGGALGALIGATAFTVWNQSVVNEKVYTVSLLGMAIVSWLAVRWSERPDGGRADRMLVMMAYLCGLGYANHMAGMLPAPAIAVAVLVRRPATLLRWRLLLVCAVVLFAGVTPFVTQPIRAAYHPALDEGEPTACRTTLAWSCTFSRGTYDAFMFNFNRGQYGKPALSDRQATFGEQVGMWWLYFKWQWLRDPNAQHALLQAFLAAAFLVLGLLGAWVHARYDRSSFWYFGTLMFTITLLLIYYLNFKLGASQDPGSPAAHEVRDRDYFFIWSFSAWGVWAALGLVHVWELIGSLIGVEERRAGKALVRAPTARAWAFASPVLALALVPLVGNWSAASRKHHRATRDVAADLLDSVEPYGVLITAGDNDTFPLWYAQEVEGIRKDVVVACTSLLNTDWNVRQMIERPIYAYDAARGPAIYRGKTWPKPAKPPLAMTLADAGAIPDYYQLDGPMTFVNGPIKATIDPRNLQYGVLQRADLVVLRMIQDSWPERPIYFARTDGPYVRSLGLENYVITQGLAQKVFVPPAAATRDTVFVPGDGWLDVATSDSLWRTFRAPRSIVAEGQWIDRPSVGMPALYLFTGAELADALRATGRAAQANAVRSTMRDVAHATKLDDLLSELSAPAPVPASGDSAGVGLRAGARRIEAPANDPVRTGVKR